MPHPTDQSSPLEPDAPTPQLPGRRSAPTAARGPYLAAVREAWLHARAAFEVAPPALAFAIAAFARDGCARRVPVETLLRALDVVIGPEAGAPPVGVDHVRVREWAGTHLIRSYFRAD